MTDKETLIEMFKRNKIEYTDEDTGNLSIEAGYVCFVSVFAFNEDGSLASVEAYE